MTDPSTPTTQPAAPAPPPPTRRPDAVLALISRSGKPDDADAGRELQAEAMAILGIPPGPHFPTPRVFVSRQDRWRFIRARAEDSLSFPDGHELAKKPRYRWYRKDPADASILLGYLVDEARDETGAPANPSTPDHAPPVTVE